jgi:hypothetical protein
MENKHKFSGSINTIGTICRTKLRASTVLLHVVDWEVRGEKGWQLTTLVQSSQVDKLLSSWNSNHNTNRVKFANLSKQRPIFHSRPVCWKK